jgi:hypothetical protein
MGMHMSGSSKRHRPGKSEYDDYYDRYISLVPDGDIIGILTDQLEAASRLLETIPPGKEEYRYAAGKWTIKEVLGHIIDTEWVFAFRGLSFARGFVPPLPGIDQDEFMSGANFHSRSIADLSLEYSHLRRAVIQLFGSFDEPVLDRTGTASDCLFSVRSIPYIIAGHEKHHIAVLKERYLPD